MIKITKAVYIENYVIALEFSDEKYTHYDFSSLTQKEGSLVEPLKDESYFKEFFLELGAICWKNGLELSPHSLYQKSKDAGSLFEANSAA